MYVTYVCMYAGNVCVRKCTCNRQCPFPVQSASGTLHLLSDLTRSH